MGIEQIKTQLEQVSEQIDDLMMTLLRDAVADGATQRPEAEKRLIRVRRSVEKAVSLLDGLNVE
ncbi:MAG: hypothetical protein F4138_04600 [Acidimicrobiia bacterium]|nr:hypothetical protein [Acidimicrobiia bacterium]MYC58500.1 hypothetical protein [Acidimicrobiia bacterium]MYG94258.1 hypothetical protein [Acidimicrobiia bacterium]MYI30394.1 hypothetical protein [Acidimicrobiia bacterium]